MTLAELETRVKTHINPDESSPTAYDLHSNSIATWANELVDSIIDTLFVPDTAVIHFSKLFQYDKSITISGGEGPLPSDYYKPLSLKAGASKLNVRLYKSVADFNRFDNGNFVVTATDERPIGFIGDKVRVKSKTAITTCYLDYITKHPTIDSSNGTMFSNSADDILVQKILIKYHENISGKTDLANRALEEIKRIVENANNIQRN